MDTQTAPTEEYGKFLGEYLRSHGEDALYRASELSRFFVESGLGPEDIIALHLEALDAATSNFSYREKARAITDSHQFLLEVMIAYGIRFKEYLELKLTDTLRNAEAMAARERERALEAERLQLEKTEILGVIAHELRTPITAVKGNLDLLHRRLLQGQVERVPELLDTAKEALERLSRLTADLVEASRGEQLKIDLSPQQLRPVLMQACAWARPAASAKGVALSYEVRDPDVAVLGNVDALLSVFGNLLSNAIRYTPPGGQVTVTCGVEDDHVWVSVKDTGIGMTPEVKARIFEKFYRAPEARRQEVRGLGLGLSLVQQMVLAHRGRIEVESADGEGSTFWVMLPRANQLDPSEDARHGNS